MYDHITRCKKAFDKIQHPTWNRRKIPQNKKAIYDKSTVNIVINRGKRKANADEDLAVWKEGLTQEKWLLSAVWADGPYPKAKQLSFSLYVSDIPRA